LRPCPEVRISAPAPSPDWHPWVAPGSGRTGRTTRWRGILRAILRYHPRYGVTSKCKGVPRQTVISGSLVIRVTRPAGELVRYPAPGFERPPPMQPETPGRTPPEIRPSILRPSGNKTATTQPWWCPLDPPRHRRAVPRHHRKTRRVSALRQLDTDLSLGIFDGVISLQSLPQFVSPGTDRRIAKGEKSAGAQRLNADQVFVTSPARPDISISHTKRRKDRSCSDRANASLANAASNAAFFSSDDRVAGFGSFGATPYSKATC